MAGTLNDAPSIKEPFSNFLISKGGLSENSAKSYISYINNLCRNMVENRVNGVCSNTALDQLILLAHSSKTVDEYVQKLSIPLHGPRGRANDLQSAAKQMFHFSQIQKQPNKVVRQSTHSAFSSCNIIRNEKTEQNNLTRELFFHDIYWLRNPPEETIINSLSDLFELLPLELPNSLGNAKGHEFDQGIKEGLKAVGCSSVSELDSQKVFSGANYTFDITATTPDGIRLLLEIEKTEVKRIIHDILKIAAGQRRDPKAIGLIIVPDRYRTSRSEFARTHLREAKAVMELLDYSHSWAGKSIGIVVYETR